MKTLIFSDTHLDTRFDEKKYRFLEGLIQQADQVIINGDFWDGFFMSFSQFLDSPYRHLFPLLKQRKTIYITGNHDSPDNLDSRTALFSGMVTQQYSLPLHDKTLILEHGNNHVDILKNNNYLLKKAKKPLAHALNAIEFVIVRGLGKQATRFLQGRFNTIIKQNVRNLLQEHEIFVCGHTHLAEYNVQEQFINIGFIKHGLGQYLMIDGANITPKEEWYG